MACLQKDRIVKYPMTTPCMLNRTFLCLYLSMTFPPFPAMPDHVDLLVWPTMLSKLLSACYCLISFVFMDLISLSLVKSNAFQLVLLVLNIFPVYRQGPESINHLDKVIARSEYCISASCSSLSDPIHVLLVIWLIVENYQPLISQWATYSQWFNLENTSSFNNLFFLFSRKRSYNSGSHSSLNNRTLKMEQRI